MEEFPYLSPKLPFPNQNSRRKFTSIQIKAYMYFIKDYDTLHDLFWRGGGGGGGGIAYSIGLYRKTLQRALWWIADKHLLDLQSKMACRPFSVQDSWVL